MLSTTTTAMDGFQLCIFDLRRGQCEGQELDKILFFFPTECPYTSQLSVIGLCEGIITFTRIFSPEAASEVIQAERRCHVFYQAEPDLWIVMVVEKNKDTESVWRYNALREILKEVHSLFTLFHGSIRSLLDNQPSGELARIHLYSFVLDYLAEFLVGKRIKIPSFRECLRERGTVQMLTTSREVAVEVQSLVTVLGSSVPNTMCNSLILFQDLLVSTTLSPGDTANVFTYALLRLTPHALSSNTNSWSYLRRAKSASNIAVVSSIPISGSIESRFASRDTSGGECQRHYFPRPLQCAKWYKGKDGFLSTDITGSEAGNLTFLTPTIWLQQTEERMCLYVYHHKNLTIVLLVPHSSLANGQDISLMKQQLLDNASQKIINVEEKLSRGWGGENAYHVSGYRYLLIDGDRNTSRASPAGKVTTLTKVPKFANLMVLLGLNKKNKGSKVCKPYGAAWPQQKKIKDSLLALSRLREEVDSSKAIAKQDKPEHEKDLEVCIRARNNAWVIAKTSRGKELYMILEKASETLLYASDAIEKFSNRYCDGAFSLD